MLLVLYPLDRPAVPREACISFYHEILESLLPKQLSEEELEKVIVEIVAALPDKSPRQMGAVMAELKKKYDGQFDGKTASGLVKKALS